MFPSLVWPPQYLLFFKSFHLFKNKWPVVIFNYVFYLHQKNLVQSSCFLITKEHSKYYSASWQSTSIFQLFLDGFWCFFSGSMPFVSFSLHPILNIIISFHLLIISLLNVFSNMICLRTFSKSVKATDLKFLCKIESYNRYAYWVFFIWSYIVSLEYRLDLKFLILS